MATSGLLNAINAVLTAIRAIPYDWSAVQDADRSLPTKLFQKVLMWNDQLNRERNTASQAKGGYLFECPACFLEMLPEENNQFTASVTNTDYRWRLHIIDRQIDAGDDITMDQNLTVMTYRDAARQALVGFQPPNCSTLFACDERQDFDHDSLYHFILDLKSCFTDTKGSYLDPDQSEYLIEEGPTNAELVTGFQDPISDDPLTDPLTLEITPP